MASKTSAERKPKIIVFDLDYTLWPFWVDTHVSPPLRKKGSGVVDSNNQEVEHYKDSPDILKTLHKEGYTLAVASRTSASREAQSLLDLFGWDKYFAHKQIYPGCKITHLTKIQKASGVAFSDIIFFDDERRNITDTTKLGVFAKLVDHGMSWSVVRQALNEYSQAKISL